MEDEEYEYQEQIKDERNSRSQREDMTDDEYDFYHGTRQRIERLENTIDTNLKLFAW